jgi:sigma-B regulation protein RsbU (phosphoserine phosphatase)
LVVDDTEEWRHIMRRVLTRGGYHVDCVTSGEEALTSIQAHRPDLVLLDVHMPGMTGYDVVARLRAEEDFADLPVVLVTAQNRMEGLLQGFELGADEYLTKPFQGPELLARVAALLRVQSLQASLRESTLQDAVELSLACSIQEALLPLPPPKRPGLDIVAAYHPCQTLGGDFFDVVPLGSQGTGLLIADVVGHGISAALITSFLKALVVHDTSPETLQNPAPTFQAMNRALLGAFGDRGLFVTGVMMVFDPNSDTIGYLNAGHPDPILIDAAGSPRPLQGKELPLGVLHSACYQVREAAFQVGERICLFTDGILEQPHHESGEFLGYERLSQALARTAEFSPAEALQQLETDFLRWSGGEQKDDVNVVIFDRLPQEPT